jgi:hypothetical protein
VNGPLVSNTGSSPYRASITRQSRGGTGDNFVGTMRFDNLITANESLLPMPDVNMDGFVDIFDVNAISASWAMMGDPYTVPGDANKDRVTDIFDVNLVSANWAPPPAPGGGSAVPEPATWLLLCLGMGGIGVVARQRSKR